MLRPQLHIPQCYSPGDDTYSIHCTCNKCMSRPSLIIKDSNLSNNEIVIVLKKLGNIRHIDREEEITVYLTEWNDEYSGAREVLRNKGVVKLMFKDAYGESHTWFLEAKKVEPRWINGSTDIPNWEKELDIKLELPADNLDLSIPGSCTPRKDGKTTEDIIEEKKKRELYYYLKNLYQTYDLNTYEDKVSEYGEGFMWDINLSKDEIQNRFMKRKNLTEIYLQKNWIPQLVKDWYFSIDGEKKYYVKELNPHERPIKDRVYEPARKKEMLGVIIDKHLTVPIKDIAVKSLKYSLAEYYTESNKVWIGYKDNVMEELLARFWFCVERKLTITTNNLVGSTGEWRLKLARVALAYYNKLFDNTSISIPDSLSRYKIEDIWCSCGNVHECEECRSYNMCYGCYFCNRIQIYPRERSRWEELYHTLPRCGCQYRIITQERVQDSIKHPDKFSHV